jgi:hypothetical protein
VPVGRAGAPSPGTHLRWRHGQNQALGALWEASQAHSVSVSAASLFQITPLHSNSIDGGALV